MKLCDVVIGAAALLFCAAACAQSAPRVVEGYVPAVQTVFRLQGSCETNLQPDTAVIVGGVAVMAVKPIAAAEQLDKQLELIKQYVAEKQGRLELMERVRSVKIPNPNSNMPENEGPFQLVQRLVASFPANAPVDEILEKMMGLGLDRFGDDVTNLPMNRPMNVVRFRISDFEAAIDQLQQKCLANAWQQWCASNDRAEKTCVPEKPGQGIQVQNFNARSTEKVLRPEGGTEYININSSWAQSDVRSPELLGNMPIHLAAHITAVYTRSDAP